MTNHEPSVEAVQTCALRIADLIESISPIVSEEMIDRIASEVLRCAVDSCGYLPSDQALYIAKHSNAMTHSYLSEKHDCENWMDRTEKAERERDEARAKLAGMEPR